MRIKNKYLNEVFKILMMIVGIFCMGTAFNSFFLRNQIVPSGFGGLAAVISELFVKLNWFYISPTILYLVMNVFLIVFALKRLGKKYFFYSILGIALYSVCIEYLNFDLQLTDFFLASVFGATLMGIGTGLVVRGGGSTGGGEMLGKILHTYNNEITVGKVIIVVDSLVLALSFATYGIKSCLYTFLAIIISGKVTDFVIDGGKGTKAYYIISDKYEEISQAIVTKLYRGATLFNGMGVFSKKEKNIVMCLLNKYEARNLKEIVFEIDDKAFLFSTSVNEAYGEGFDKKVRYVKSSQLKKKQGTVEEKIKNAVMETIKEDKIETKSDDFQDILTLDNNIETPVEEEKIEQIEEIEDITTNEKK